MQITCAGRQTHYEHLGSKGPILVLLHGWGCSWEIFAPIVGELSREFQLILPDLPGFGQSALPGLNDQGFAWDSHDYLKWLKDFLRQTVSNKNFVIGGHSFGGKVAALLAHQNTTTAEFKLQGLILIDSAGLPNPLALQEQFSYVLSSFIPGFLKRVVPSQLKNRLLAAANIATDYQAAQPELRAVLRRIVREDLRDELSQITLPSLVCWGSLDATTPLHQGREMTKLIHNAQLVEFDQSQHYPFADQPAKFIGTVSNFVAALNQTQT